MSTEGRTQPADRYRAISAGVRNMVRFVFRKCVRANAVKHVHRSLTAMDLREAGESLSDNAMGAVGSATRSRVDEPMCCNVQTA